MKYYSEDTVRRIIRTFAHTALEQLSLYADNILQNQPSIEIKEPHGRLIDANEAKEAMFYEMCGTGYQSRACRILDSDLCTPTILEASKEESK